MAPNALQASVCDEELKSIGGEIALSENNAMWTGTRRSKRCMMGVLHSMCVRHEGPWLLLFERVRLLWLHWCSGGSAAD